MAILLSTGRPVVRRPTRKGARTRVAGNAEVPYHSGAVPLSVADGVGKRMAQLARVRTPVLDFAYEHGGPGDGLPAVLLHGYPYDPRAFDEVAAILNAEGLRTIVPYLRGY